jgi:4-hydroxy-tetrahydrodipicolinate reductase
VAGVKQVATIEGLTLELQMYVGAPNPRDEIHIDGNPDLHAVIQGGTPGDVATPAILVNMLPRLLEAGPGLHTMATLPLPRLA